jgi:hypothetical protein
LYSEFQRQQTVLNNPTHDLTANLEMNIIATGGITIKTDAQERYSAVVRTEKPQKETYTVQIVLTTIPTLVITPVIITTSLVDALERVSAVVLTKKHQNTIVKELTVALQRNTAVVITEHQPNHAPTERL